MVSILLFKGKENAQTAKTLSKQLNMTQRELTQEIERERRAGSPICASCGQNPGYYLAANRKEMTDYCDSLKSRGIEIFKTRKACQQTIENLEEE